jgi:hypothetical protein
MNNNYLFQPKLKGSVSFRHQGVRLNDENGFVGKNLVNMNKSSHCITEESANREFGKDITNLTIINQENIDPNSRDEGRKESKNPTVNS